MCSRHFWRGVTVRFQCARPTFDPFYHHFAKKAILVTTMLTKYRRRAIMAANSGMRVYLGLPAKRTSEAPGPQGSGLEGEKQWERF